MGLMLHQNRIYISTPTKIAILDHEKKRTFVLRKEGLPAAGARVSCIAADASSNTFAVASDDGRVFLYTCSSSPLESSKLHPKQCGETEPRHPTFGAASRATDHKATYSQFMKEE